MQLRKLLFALAAVALFAGMMTASAAPMAASQAERQEFANLSSRQLSGEQLDSWEKERLEVLRQRLLPSRETNPLDNVGGPDAYGYTFKDNVAPDTATYNWIELRGDPLATWLQAADFTSSDDGMTISTYPIAFGFPFYGQSYTSFRLGSNGDVQFTTNYAFEYTTCIPRPSSGAMLTAFSTDLHLMNGGIGSGNEVIGFRDFGTYMVIEWDSIGYWSSACSGGSLKYQVILYNTGRIKMQYNQLVIPGACNTSYPPNIGIQQDGNTGASLVYACGQAGIFPENGRAIWWYLPDGIPQPVTNLNGSANGTTVTLTWTDPTQDTNGNPITVDSVQVWLGSPDGAGIRVGVVNPGVQTFVHNNAPQGNHIYYVRAANDGFYGTAVGENVVVGDASYVSDFEDDNGSWSPEPETGGWEWGAPSSGPNGAHSGQNLWGTLLADIYPNNGCFNLDLNLGLVVQSPTASLEFWMWYSSEQGWDGCHVKVSTDAGSTWELVTPEGGYPVQQVGDNPCIGTATPCWSGNSNGWQYAVLPIGQYVGQVPIFRFVFGSDPIINGYPGFYFDDVIIWGMEVPDVPVGVQINGNYDDRIRINWLPMGTPALATQISYDNGMNSADVDGLGWWSDRPESGWMVAHYRHDGAVDVSHVRAYFTRHAQAGAPIQVGVFADAGGVPSATPMAVIETIIEPPFDIYRDFELPAPVTVANGSYFVGVRQMTNHALALGGDAATPFPRQTFYYADRAGEWNTFEPALPVIPMLGARTIGSVDVGSEPLTFTPVELERGPVAKAASKQAAKQTRAAAFTGGPAYKPSLTTADRWQMAGRSFFTVAPYEPNCETVSADRIPPGNPLDEVLYYKIYRNNTFLVNDTLPPYFDIVGSNNEGVTYNYFITAWFDDNTESGHSDTVSGAASMAPGQPGNLQGGPVGQTQWHLTWTDPATNIDGTNCTDLAALAIYRNDTFVATVNPGVQQYTDTPPEPTFVYTWTVRARDEVPNEGPGTSVTGAVQSPWQPTDYEWVDISQIGTVLPLTLDDYSDALQIGFDFTYFEQTYSQLWVASHGFITFDDPGFATPPFTETPIPNPTPPNNCVYTFWDDNSSSTTGTIYYYADAAEGRFIVSWDGVGHYISGEQYWFQMILTDDGGITMNYQTIPFNNSCTIGVEDVTGANGRQVVFDGDGWLPENETAIQFWGGPSGRVEGIVRAFSGNQPIEGVRVETAELPEFTYTDANGFYSLRLEAGVYSLMFSKPGYCDTTYTNILVEDDGTTVRNATLRSPQAAFSVTSISVLTWPNHNISSTFEISNPAGQCALDFSIADTSAWLSTTPSNGSVPPNGSMTITVNMAVQGMAPGSEHISELVITHDALNSPRTIPVTLTVSLDGEGQPSLPAEYALYQNYPNPFNAQTSVRFDLPTEGAVKLVLYNVTGQAVATLADGNYPAGRHTLNYEAGDLPSGMYLLKLESGTFTSMKKVLLLK